MRIDKTRITYLCSGLCTWYILLVIPLILIVMRHLALGSPHLYDTARSTRGLATRLRAERQLEPFTKSPVEPLDCHEQSTHLNHGLPVYGNTQYNDHLAMVWVNLQNYPYNEGT